MKEFGMPFDMPKNSENPDDYIYSAAEERMRIGAGMTDGVFPTMRMAEDNYISPEKVIANALMVTPGDGLNVRLNEGVAICGHTYYFNTAVKNIPVNAGATTDIVINLDLISSRIYAMAQERTAETAIENSLIRTAGTWQICVASITVPEDSEQVTADMITDQRLNTTPCSSPDGNPVCGLVSGIVQLSYQMILDEWEHIKGQLAEDPAGNLQLQIDAMKTELTEKINGYVSMEQLMSII